MKFVSVEQITQRPAFVGSTTLGTLIFIFTPEILNCTEKRTIITLLKEINGGTEVVMTWTDPNPIPINGVGIMTGWGADGLWTIEYPSFLIGRFCGIPTTYGNMMLLSTSIKRTRIICLSICSPNRACLGVNFNKETNECEFVSSGQIIQTISRQDWSFYTKC
ncbi:unnamed protein product [Mytilus edulis]|uniref:Apple domain-containing protein n=1 Tax=Mytilus edulis TaxID=6550 RepID=A0A8S3PTW8_MYTED|nr:unnamed protein product [Mytilus edulis]